MNKDIKKSKNEYYKRVFDNDCLRSGNKVWRKINELLNQNTKDYTIDNLVINDKTIGGTELANLFNNFFVEIGSSTYCHEATNRIPRLSHTMYLQPTSVAEVRMLYQKLRNSRSRDVDDLEIKPIKYVIDLIAPVLTHIYNVSISTGIFPDSMQVARVSVIYKNGDKNSLSNYRPVSILPIFSKGLEKVINCRIAKFTTKYNLLTDHQFGFRKGRCTETALLVQKEEILYNFENKVMTLGIFLDFSKAFDRVNHSILFEKLEHYGLRGTVLQLVKSYLKTRYQYVELNKCKSNLRHI